MFASQSLTEHVLRGLGGFGAIALAFWLAPAHPAALLLLLLGLLFFRGCPMCWTLGLIETITNTVRRRAGQAPVELCTTCDRAMCPGDHYDAA